MDKSRVRRRKTAIELKYKTLSYHCIVDGESFYLNNLGAQDVGRYDILKDIHRLEEIVLTGGANEGLLLVLTNDQSYYSIPNHERITVDGNFCIYKGKMVTGHLVWDEPTGKGTMKGREKPIIL